MSGLHNNINNNNIIDIDSNIINMADQDGFYECLNLENDEVSRLLRNCNWNCLIGVIATQSINQSIVVSHHRADIHSIPFDCHWIVFWLI